MVGALEEFRACRDLMIPDHDRTSRIGQEVEAPRRPLGRGRDEQRPIVLRDEPDGHCARQTRSPSGGREKGDATDTAEGPSDLVDVPQRARCQDLPSVATEGAYTISTRCIAAIVGAPSAAID